MCLRISLLKVTSHIYGAHDDLTLSYRILSHTKETQIDLSQNAVSLSAQFRMFASQTGCVDKIEKERSKQVESETQWASLARQLRQNVTSLQGTALSENAFTHCPICTVDPQPCPTMV